MKIAEVRKILRNHTGPVMVAMVMRNDCPYVRVVYSDLVEVLKHAVDDEVQVSIRDGVAYIDRAV